MNDTMKKPKERKAFPILPIASDLYPICIRGSKYIERITATNYVGKIESDEHE